MSLEQAIQANTEAINRLIEALSNVKSVAESKTAEAEAKQTRRGRPPKAEAEASQPVSKYTAEEVKAAAVKVKSEKGAKVAKQLIKDHGAEQLADLKPEQFDAFVKACEAVLNGGDEGEEEDDL
ncbi:MAG: hypothetical protein WC096_08760 [Sphaerochaetaceae bacterium]